MGGISEDELIANLVKTTTLEEALKDFHDNERDMKMFELMIEGDWNGVHQPQWHLDECRKMQPKIEKLILALGGEIPAPRVF